jgi:hypothetical protein
MFVYEHTQRIAGDSVMLKRKFMISALILGMSTNRVNLLFSLQCSFPASKIGTA